MLFLDERFHAHLVVYTVGDQCSSKSPVIKVFCEEERERFFYYYCNNIETPSPRFAFIIKLTETLEFACAAVISS